MLQRPLYRASVALLTLAAFAGGVWTLVAPQSPPGIEITLPGPGAAKVSAPSATTTLVTDKVDINGASAAELAQALPGIGEVLSQRIVAHREVNGPFVRTDQIMAVSGIGPATYERIAPLISVGD